MKSRIVSWLLVLTMIVTMCSISDLRVYAEVPTDVQTEQTEEILAEPEVMAEEVSVVSEAEEVAAEPEAAAEEVAAEPEAAAEEAVAEPEEETEKAAAEPEAEGKETAAEPEAETEDMAAVSEETSEKLPAVKADPAEAKPAEESSISEEETSEIVPAKAGSTVITKVELTTAISIPDMITVGADVPLIEDNKTVVVTRVESEDGPLDTGLVAFDPGDSGWFFFDHEDYFEWFPYQEGTSAGTQFYDGENQFRTWLYIPDDTDAVFGSGCEFFINGKKMEVMEYLSGMKDVYLRVSVYGKPTIREIWLQSENQKNWAGKAVEDPAVTIEKIVGNTDIPMDAITAKAYWSYYVEGDYYDYSSGAVFKEGNNALKVEIFTASSDYALANSSDAGDDYLRVYLNGYRLSNYTYAGEYMTIKKDTFTINHPEISVERDDLGADSESKVSLDNTNWGYSDYEYFPLSTYVTLYAKPDTNSEFVCWRNADTDETVGTGSTYTFLVTGPARYIAEFQTKIPATGTLCDSVDYQFNASTGTLTLIPTEDDGNGGKTGYARTGNWNTSPFRGNKSIKHIVVREGITGIGDYVFYDNDIETVSFPASFTDVSWRAFEETSIIGNGFTVDPANEYFTVADGSLIKYGVTLVKFVKKPAQTEYTIPEGIVSIATECFEETQLDRLTIRGDGLDVLDYAFDYSIIKEIVIEEGVTSIRYQRFDHEMSTINLPASLTYIDRTGGMFENDGLQAINVASGGERYFSSDGVLYLKISDGSELVKYPNAKAGASFTIPEGTKVVGSCAFRGKKSPITVTLPEEVRTIDYTSFGYTDGFTVIIENPDCDIASDAFYYAKNAVIKGLIGSTAQQYAAEHPDLTFVSTGENHGKLSNPVNLRWEGNIAKWDPVPNAARYNVKYYRKEPGMTDYIYMDSEDAQITDGTCEYDFSTVLWYQDSDYMFTVTASATGYEPSDTVQSPVRNGRFTIRPISYTIEGDILTVGFTDDEGVAPEAYYLFLKDMADNDKGYLYLEGNQTQINLHEKFSEAYMSFGQYKMTMAAYASATQVGGWQILIGSADTPVVYEHKEIPKISKIEVTIPDPVVGEDRQLTEEQLNVKAYAGSVQHDAVHLIDGYYNNQYVYKEKIEDYYWESFYDKIERDKAAYGYVLQLNTRSGYQLADDVDLYINGEKTDATMAETTAFSNSYIQFRYMFPDGTKAKESIKNAVVAEIAGKAYTGSAIRPEPAVTLDGKTLVKDVDYTLSYANNIKAGTASVTIAGKGTYFDSVTRNFTITQVKISSAKLKYSVLYYTGKARTQSSTIVVKAKVDGTTVTLKNSTDYKIAYSNNTNVGIAAVTITGKGNFKGTIKKTFQIRPKGTSISGISAGTKKLIVKWKKQDAQIDYYQIQYSTDKNFKTYKTKNVKKGTYKITLTGLEAGKTYYLRIRTYKKAGGKTYYSKYSTVLSKKTK